MIVRVADGDPHYSGRTNKPFAITKAVPAPDSYTIPTNLTAAGGQTLADVPLPEGWTWGEPSTGVGSTAGEYTFSATYTPPIWTTMKA